MIRLSWILIFFLCCCGKRSIPIKDTTTRKTPVVIQDTVKQSAHISTKLILGAEQIPPLLDQLKEKRVALVVNYTAMVGHTHLVDTLQTLKTKLIKILAPEHGFRGNAEAGEYIKDGIDSKTGVPVISIYGSNRKPTAAQLSDVDVVLFDIQDVGARFFTYISTLHYVMEACAENNKKVIVLDRPNPNAHYIDGPIMEPAFKSFVGMHPIPIVHGLTVGELAKMINGEGWLAGSQKCDLTVIPMKNWSHKDAYSLPIKPSPNLPNDQAVKLYPSICLFEGTVISLGRGTQMPFQVIGHPAFKSMPFQFTPVDIAGMATNPPLKDQVCYGLDLSRVPVASKVDLSYLIRFYQAFPDKEKFFIPFFEKLAGTASLRKQIQDGMSETDIRASWQKDLALYKTMRKKYLLYED
jgi:uncharacterized protein YbbC (DUF1343 family)